MKTLISFFKQSSNRESFESFEKYSINRSSMNMLRGGGDPGDPDNGWAEEEGTGNG